MIDISPQISFLFFSIWLIIFLAGKYQFNKITKYSTSLVERHIQSAISENPKLTVNEYFNQIYQEWELHISKKYYFIPHKTELFPIRTSPENVVKRINFTPEWVGAYLQLHGYHLERTKEQEIKITEIINMAPKSIQRNK
jgi:hypothetical protein